MQASLRTHLTAGVVAAVGAGVLTVVPAAHVPALPTVTANVAMAGFNNPIEEVLGTVQLVQTYLLAGYYNGADGVTPGAGEANWPYAGFDQPGGDYLNTLLHTSKSLGYYQHVGLFPEIITANQPIIDQITINLLGYLSTALTGATSAGTAAAAGVWNFPSAAVDAVQLLLNGQAQDAFKVIVDAIVTPIAAVAADLAGAAGDVARTVAAHLVSVVKVIPTNLQLFGGWLFGGGTYLVKKAVAIASQWAQDLGTRNFEGAWNTAIDGLFGPSGLPGSAFNVSLGAGLQTGPISTPNDIKSNYIPSLRTAIQATLWNTQVALTTVPAAPAAATPARAAAALPAAPKVAAEVTPVVNTPAVNAPTINTVVDAPQTDTGSGVVARRGQQAVSGAGESTDAAPVKARRTARSAGTAAG